MADFEFVWSRSNEGDDPTTHSTRASGSTVEKAQAKAEAVFHPGELDGFTLSVTELDEDGDPI